jgi:hypothetical protein
MFVSLLTGLLKGKLSPHCSSCALSSHMHTLGHFREVRNVSQQDWERAVSSVEDETDRLGLFSSSLFHFLPSSFPHLIWTLYLFSNATSGDRTKGSGDGGV